MRREPMVKKLIEKLEDSDPEATAVSREPTVRTVIEELKRCDPEAIVVIPGYDHSYVRVRPEEREADQFPSSNLYETWSEDWPVPSEPTNGKKVKVVVFV